jgi:hypothetical protein
LCDATDKRFVKSEGFAGCAHPRTGSRGDEFNKSAFELKDSRPQAEDSSPATGQKCIVLTDEFHRSLLYWSLAARDEPLRRSRRETLELLVSISERLKGAAISLTA